MASDFTPLVVGLVGVAFGGVGSTAMTALIERGKLKHERDISEADRVRAFRVEALERSQQSLLKLHAVAMNAATAFPPPATLPPEMVAEVNECRADAIRWVDRLETELRNLGNRCIGVCVGYANIGRNTAAGMSAVPEYERLVPEAIQDVQRGISLALRSMFGQADKSPDAPTDDPS